MDSGVQPALIEVPVGTADRHTVTPGPEADLIAIGRLACALTSALSLSTMLGLMHWWL